ncbi:hypothetical protein JHL17_32120 [Azospirillum sp. YIM B02556]|uniref:Uncharacterized protein n=1 Tax=Azospirillum endophyticum TaxID=2800326 RepID=A0ABS1FF43_9PROT|nr:hypothetical protein [Azospirillum endophyticum]MBK1842053.1 hypothetical protein [Azospirillum endophyticum]
MQSLKTAIAHLGEVESELRESGQRDLADKVAGALRDLDDHLRALEDYYRDLEDEAGSDASSGPLI